MANWTRPTRPRSWQRSSGTSDAPSLTLSLPSGQTEVMDIHIDGVERRGAGWPDWQITTRIDTLPYWHTVWKAVSCHQTQLPAYHHLEGLPEEQHKALWGSQTFYCAFSLVNGGRTVENDLFEGLRF